MKQEGQSFFFFSRAQYFLPAIEGSGMHNVGCVYIDCTPGDPLAMEMWKRGSLVVAQLQCSGSQGVA